jgi:outer membrane protein assembly factor BamB
MLDRMAGGVTPSDHLEISLAGRWRAGLDALAQPPVGATDSPPDRLALDARLLAVRDHIRLRIGDRSLTAHLEDDAILPVLTALSERLARQYARQSAETTVAIGRGDHQLLLRSGDGALWITLTGPQGFVVRDSRVDPRAFRRSLLALGDAVCEALAAGDPGIARTPAVRKLRRALGALRRGPANLRPLGAGASGPTDPAARPPRERWSEAAPVVLRVPRPVGGERAPLEPALDTRQPLDLRVGDARLAVPHGQPLLLVESLLGTVEAMLRPHGGAQRTSDVGLDGRGLHRLRVERTAAGLTATVIDRGGHPLAPPVLVTPLELATSAERLRREASRGRPRPEPDPEHRALRRLSHGIRRWARAAAAGPTYGAPAPSPTGRASTTTAPTSPERGPPEQPRLPVAQLHRLAWHRRWSATLDAVRTVRAHGDARLIVSHARGLEALDRLGARLWHRPGLRAAGSDPTLAKTRRGALVRLDPTTGRTCWRVDPPGEEAAFTTLHRSGGQVLLGTSLGAVLAVDAERGSTRWRADAWFGALAGLAADAAHCFFFAEDGYLHAVGLGDGAPRFSVTLPVEPDVEPEPSSGGLLLAGHADPSPAGHVYALCSATGRVRWSAELPGAVTGPPALRPAAALFPVHRDGTSQLVCIRLQSGQIAWVAPIAPAESTRHPLLPWWSLPADDPDGVVLHDAPAVICRGLLLVPGTTIRAVDPADGRVIQHLSCDDLLPDWMHAWPNGDLVVASEDQVVGYELGGHIARVG